MASRGSRSKPSKRAKTDTSSKALVGTSNEANGPINTPNSPSTLVNAKGNQTVLSFDFFQDLPADILGEIVGYLAPADLLHLARTTRELRVILMSASSSVFWKRARQNASDLPQCPNDLSEPAFVHLLFSDFCHKCLAADRDVLLHLEARTQLCESCTLEEFSRWQELPEEADTALSEFVPDTMNQLTAKEKKQTWSRSSAEYQRVARTRFHVKTAMRLHNEYKKLRGAKKTAWLEEREKPWAEIETHARVCRDYISRQRWKARDAVWVARRRRAEQIQDRLTELGYGDEFRERARCAPSETPSSNRASLTLVIQEHDLTDTEWDEMRDDLVQWMQEVRESREARKKLHKMCRRVESSLGDVYSTFALTQPAGAMIPTLAELALMEEFAEPLDSVSLDEGLPEGALDSVIANIPELVEGWQAQLENSLLDLLRQSSAYAGRNDLTRDVLSYASTLFTCTHCVGALTYPGIFAHSCFSLQIGSVDIKSMAPGNRLKKVNTSASSKTVLQASQDGRGSGALVPATFGYGPGQVSFYRVWHPGQLLQFNEAMHYHTVSLLDQLLLDRTTTSTTLLDLNPYVEGVCQCFPTGHNSTSRMIMRWLQALSQCRRHRSRNYTNSFKLIGQAELQDFSGYPANPTDPFRYRCFLCGSCMFSLSWHLTRTHGFSQVDATTACQLAPHLARHADSTLEIGAGGKVSRKLKRTRYYRG